MPIFMEILQKYKLPNKLPFFKIALAKIG